MSNKIIHWTLIPSFYSQFHGYFLEIDRPRVPKPWNRHPVSGMLATSMFCHRCCCHKYHGYISHVEIHIHVCVSRAGSAVCIHQDDGVGDKCNSHIGRNVRQIECEVDGLRCPLLPVLVALGAVLHYAIPPGFPRELVHLPVLPQDATGGSSGKEYYDELNAASVRDLLTLVSCHFVRQDARTRTCFGS